MKRGILFAVFLFGSLLVISACALGPMQKTEPDVVFVTTPHSVVREMLKLASVGKNDIVYDLGSGDGRIVIAAARDFGARAVGIEIDRKLVDESIQKARDENVSEMVSFRTQDIFASDIGEATVVTLFLLPGVNRMLAPKLLKELRPGTPIVSHRFDMGDWRPDMTLAAFGSVVYLWRIPARVDGDWEVTISENTGARTYRLRLYQDYQQIRGSEVKKGARLERADLFGKEIAIRLEDRSLGLESRLELEGNVEPEVMEGTAKMRGAPPEGYRWRAVRVGGANGK